MSVQSTSTVPLAPGRRVVVVDDGIIILAARRHLVGAHGRVLPDPGAGAAEDGLLLVELDGGDRRYFFPDELEAEAPPADAELEREHHAAARGSRCGGRRGYHKCDRLAGHAGLHAQAQPSGAWLRWLEG